jgi:hypothetical protein
MEKSYGLQYDIVFWLVHIQEYLSCITSQWGQSGEGSSSLKVVNATQFFEKLGIGNFMVDLITINCEGCEYDLLETLLSTHFVYYFKNIQFGSHTKIKGLGLHIFLIFMVCYLHVAVELFVSSTCN